MIVVLSDTHRTEGHGLSGPLLAAVRDASTLVHAGDFTTPAVFEAFDRIAERVVAVHGNADRRGLQERLPAQRVVDIGGLRLAVVHGHEHSTTARSFLGREAGAAVVVAGHTHRPTVAHGRGVVHVNPGSHADPRGGPATYATIDTDDAPTTISGTICDFNGSVRDRFSIRPREDD